VLVFIAPPDMDDLERRLRARGTNSEQDIQARLRIARTEMGAMSAFEHVIVNDEVDEAAGRLVELIEATLKRGDER